MINADGMVGRLMKLVKNAYMPAALCSSSEYCQAELFLAYSLTAGKGEDYASWTYFPESNGVQTGIPLQCVTDGILMLCKGRGIQHNEVIVFASTF